MSGIQGHSSSLLQMLLSQTQQQQVTRQRNTVLKAACQRLLIQVDCTEKTVVLPHFYPILPGEEKKPRVISRFSSVLTAWARQEEYHMKTQGLILQSSAPNCFARSVQAHSILVLSRSNM